jgi:large subunit ribosomal protein L20
MVRVKRGTTTKKRHKKIRKQTRGMRGARKRTIKKGREALMKAGSYAYRDRRTKKRVFRKLWIVRLNAFLKSYGISYSQFIAGLKKNKIEIDRKILAQLAVSEPKTLEKLIKKIHPIKSHLRRE